MSNESGTIPLTETPVGREGPLHLRYFSLLRANPDFRRLWLAQLVSEIGDWFYSLAVYTLLLELTGSGKAVALAIILQTLPWFFMTPLAGPIVDRLSRRRLMIVADIARAFVVLGLLLARSRSEVWLIYTLLGIEVVFSSLFEPARNALLPNLVRKEEILPANALSAATWSLALTMGGALGGAVAALLGRQVAFVINSFSFFASALLLLRIRASESHLEAEHGAEGGAGVPGGANTLREGWDYLRRNPNVVALILAKMGDGILGGGLLLFAIFGERVFPIAGRGALAVGLLYSARGVGAGMGPILGDFFTRGRESLMWQSIGLSFFLLGVCYVAFSRAPNLALAALAVVCAHIGGSIIWVMTTALLQINTVDRLRGRVFALDLGLLMLSVAGTNYLIGSALDNWRISPREIALGFGLVLFIPGLLWLPVQAKWGRPTPREKS